MKSISSPACLADRAVVRGRAVCGIGFLLATALFSTGCHKAGDATANDASATAPAAPAPVAPAPDNNQNNQNAQGSVVNPQPQQASAPAQVDSSGRPFVRPNGEPDLHVLDGALLDWRFSHQRKPASFAEFAASAGIVIPPPPPGKKYSLAQTGHIILINQ
ncbi:MAG TPA: hypothetical protein VN048_05240 [Verrucomicrobiae bacterium]|nr:hypothetical protein [Verrucomicrobiae bacterium]